MEIFHLEKKNKIVGKLKNKLPLHRRFYLF